MSMVNMNNSDNNNCFSKAESVATDTEEYFTIFFRKILFRKFDNTYEKGLKCFIECW